MKKRQVDPIMRQNWVLIHLPGHAFQWGESERKEEKTSGSNYAAKSSDFWYIFLDMLFNNVKVKSVKRERESG